MPESGSEALPKASGAPVERRQPENSNRTTPQLPEGETVTEPEPEPVPSTSGTSPRGKKFAVPKARMGKKKKKRRKTREERMIAAFKFIRITENCNDSVDDGDGEDGGLDNSNNSECPEDGSAMVESPAGPANTNLNVQVAEDEPRPSTSFGFPPGTSTPGNEPQPDSEEDMAEEELPAPAPDPVPLPRVVPLNTSVMSSMPFHNFKLPKDMIRNLRDSLGITTATILQEKAIPILMQEKDAFMHALPGSGKTVSFAVSIIHHLSLIKPRVCSEDGIRALVLVPSREWAMQTYEILRAVGKTAPWIVVGQVGGGENFRTEKEIMKAGVTVLVATPLRFMDHLRHTSNIFLKNVSCLVVDGVDRIFQQGDERNLTDIIAVLEKGLDFILHPDYISSYKTEHAEAPRQTILISQVVTQKVARFVGLNTTVPTLIDDRFGSAPRLITIPVVNLRGARKYVRPPPPLFNQYYMVVPEKMKLVALIGFIMWKCKVAKENKVLVFVGTQTMVDFYSDLFYIAYGQTLPEGEGESPRMKMAGMDVYKVSPFMNTTDKVNLFIKFSRSKCGVLFCADSAVKGVALPRVDWVVQFSPPTCSAGYMSRIGMTNPGVQIGSSVTFLLPQEKGYSQELRNHDIPLTEMKMKKSLRYLWAFYPPSSTIDDMTFNIQSTLEGIVNQSAWMRDRACLAFASWCRLYTSYPKDLKRLFHLNYIHMDKHARSFALQDHVTFITNQARKLHMNARRFTKRRRAPGVGARPPEVSPPPQLSPPPPPSSSSSPAEMEIRSSTTTQTPIGVDANSGTMYIHLEALGGPYHFLKHLERKKREYDERMRQSGSGAECPRKRSK